MIGEHTDYNEGFVLPFALPFRTFATVRSTSSASVSVRSAAEAAGAEFAVAVAPGELTGWAAYVGGMVWALRTSGYDVPGLDVAIESRVPIGAGLSSSAALECAVAVAVADELGLDLGASEVAGLARRAENEFVGVPSGAMDQLASMLCRAGHAMLLDCRTMAATQIAFDLAGHGLAIVLTDTRARHSLVESGYADRRLSCEVAAATLGIPALRDATTADLARIADDVVRRRARHVVTENQRVLNVAALLRSGEVTDVGPVMTASHVSMRDDFEISCPEVDLAVDAALAAGALGARMTGGGFGGCVLALCGARDASRVRTGVASAFGKAGYAAPASWEVVPSAGAVELSA